MAQKYSVRPLLPGPVPRQKRRRVDVLFLLLTRLTADAAVRASGQDVKGNGGGVRGSSNILNVTQMY